MMNFPLTTNSILEYIENEYPQREIVSYCENNTVIRYNYQAFALRVKQLANSLRANGIKEGDRVATLAWNTHRHMELYYAISGIGAICHTINPRYSESQIKYIVKHAKDKALYFDGDFSAMAELIADSDLGVEQFICLSAEQPKDKNFTLYENEISQHATEFTWPALDENIGAALCYTSGTTGDPKGVLYTHRSICLHSIISSHQENLNINSQDVICPIVPLFHVNAWGLPYTAPMFGASLVFAGSNMQADALYQVLDNEQVTYIAGVPTILTTLLNKMEAENIKPKGLQKLLVGGAAPNATFIEKFETNFNINVIHGWGMTETSPVATLCTPKPHIRENLSASEQLALKIKQGRRPYGVQLKIVDDHQNALPHDGETHGELLVKGAWVSERYYGHEKSSSTPDGWFETGDIAIIDPDGYMQIVDRSKDVIKSGGEWISSVTLENTAATMPQIAQAAVIGIAHPKWTERPLMLIVKQPQTALTEQQIKDFLAEKIPTWWLPDAYIFVDALPLGATGKVQKKALREQYSHIKLGE